jgi:hypothetical protein
MSKDGKEADGAEEIVAAFVVGKIDGRVVRLQTPEAAPEGAEVITHESAMDLSLEVLGELYGSIAGVNAKKFKTKRVAIECIGYQVAKLPIFDPNAKKVGPPRIAKGVQVAPGVVNVIDGKKVGRKSTDQFELLKVVDPATTLAKLAPQARELVAIMADLAAEKSSTIFAGPDLEEFLAKPEIGARLKTRQEPTRILQYYKAKLITLGVIRVS